MPGTVFLNPNGPTAKAKEPKRVPRESPETPKGSLGVGLAYLGCSALAFLALGAIATAFFLIMYQRT
jgi:hypothetical protein